MTQVTVIQLSHADDEPGHHGTNHYITKCGQEEHRSTAYCEVVFEQRHIDIVKCMPSGSGEITSGQFLCGYSRVMLIPVGGGRGEGGDIHKEINNSISHKLLHVPVRLPLFGCFVHLN